MSIPTCRTLWAEDFAKVDMTSLLVDATFYKGKMFNSAGAIMDSPKLRRKLEDGFVRNCRLYTDISLYVAMGDGVGTIFGKLQESGVIKSSIVTMPHPSGANAGRIAMFLGEKECTDRATSRARGLFDIAYATVKIISYCFDDELLRVCGIAGVLILEQKSGFCALAEILTDHTRKLLCVPFVTLMRIKGGC